MTLPQKSGQEYKIIEALIENQRGTDPIDVKNFIGEISFFEHLNKPYVTAQIAIMDDAGIVPAIGFKGTETIKITIGGVEEGLEDLQFTYTFNMVSIMKNFRTSEKTSVYVFKCISPHAYRDANIKISKSYTGSLERIAEVICQNYLNLQVDLSYSINSVQDPVRVVLPYISPLQSCKWLLDRATSQTGCPYYIWATLYDQTEESEGIRIGNIETMFQAPVFNERAPYLYSPAVTNTVAELPLEQQAVIVKDLKVVDVEDTLKMMNEAAVGSTLTSLDTFNSQKFSRHFKLRDLLDRLKSKQVIPDGSEQNVFDDKQKLTVAGTEQFVDDLDASFINTITSFGTYGSVNSYHDVQDQTQALNKLRASAIRTLLMKNMIEITIPGIAFFAALKDGGRGVSVGDIIRVNILNSDVFVEGEYDDEKSGYYLIYACRNIYRDTTHDIVLTITKLSDNPA